MNKHKHSPRHNKISLTHDKGGHAANVLHKNKIEESIRSPSRAYVNGRYLPLLTLSLSGSSKGIK